jgi:hypothetical protein
MGSMGDAEGHDCTHCPGRWGGPLATSWLVRGFQPMPADKHELLLHCKLFSKPATCGGQMATFFPIGSMTTPNVTEKSVPILLWSGPAIDNMRDSWANG